MANFYVNVAGSGSKTGGSWANAFGLAEWLTHMTATVVAGAKYYVAGGTYTLTAAFSSGRSGAIGNGINIIGVNSGTTNEPPVPSDYADGTDRPAISCGEYGFSFAMYWNWRGIEFTLNSLQGIIPNYGSAFVNCKVSNSYSSGTCVTIGTWNGYPYLFIDCEFTSPDGAGIDAIDRVIVDRCYFHDIITAAITAGDEAIVVTNSIFKSCQFGAQTPSCGNNVVIGNTFYDCYKAVDGASSGNNVILNNAICSCTNGLYFTSAVNQTLVDYNNYYGNTTDVTNAIKGSNDISVDPGFTDAANGNFSILSTSGLVNMGFKIRVGVS